MSGVSKTLLTIVYSVVALTVGVGTLLGLASLKTQPKPIPQEERTYNVSVFDAEQSDLQQILSSFGTAHADREVVLAGQVTGEIVEIHPKLRVGQTMHAAEIRIDGAGTARRSKGDLLLRIDPKPYRERLAQAANRIAENDATLARLRQEEINSRRILEKVTADYETFKQEYRRMEKLRDSNAVTPSQLVRALLELRQYEDTLIKRQNAQTLFPLQRNEIEKLRETHQTDLAMARLDLDHTEVRPPFSGSLSDVTAELGQYVRAGDPLARLTDVSVVEIPIPLTLKDFAKVEPSVKAGRYPKVALAENESDRPRWTGYVVRAAPEADELTRTIMVYAHVKNDEQQVPLLPGTFVHARIEGPVLKNVLAVPRDAIVNGRLFVARNGRAEQRTITTTQKLRSLALVSSGLAHGDRVILTNLDVIHDGAKINVQSHRALPDELESQPTMFVRPSLAGTGTDDKQQVH